MSRQATQPQSTSKIGEPRTQDVNGVGRSSHLDASLDKAHKLAVDQQHGGVSSEHLLFALTEDADALVVLGASTVSIDRLRADISTHLGQLPSEAPAGRSILPTPDLLKVLKLAAMAAQQSARRQIDGAIVLAAIIGDASTPSAGLLKAHGLTFNEVIRVLQRGTQAAQEPREVPPQVPPTAVAVETPVEPTAQPAQPSTTDELLASVRARLQEAAPPPVSRRPAVTSVPPPTPPAAEAVSPDPTGAEVPVEPTPQAEKPARATATTDGPVQIRPEPSSPPVTGPAPPPATPPPLPPATPPGLPRSPDELTIPVQQRPLPPPTGVARVTPPQLPAADGPSAVLPTVLRAAGPMPAPMPRPVVTAPPMRVPPIPPVVVDIKTLLGAVPRRMRNGQTELIEITVPRRVLEIPIVPGHRWPPLRVASLRLRSINDDAYVELASPESLWISPPRVHQGADDATWRWRITPRVDGHFKIALSGATRIVGGEGISGEIPLGEEIVEVEAQRRGSRRGFIGLLLFGNLLALGLLAMVMSGKAGEIAGDAWAAIRGLWGG